MRFMAPPAEKEEEGKSFFRKKFQEEEGEGGKRKSGLTLKTGDISHSLLIIRHGKYGEIMAFSLFDLLPTNVMKRALEKR